MSNSDKVKSQGDSMQPLEPGQGGEAALNCKEDEKMPENSEEKAEMKVCSKSLGLEGASDLDTEKTSCDHVSTSSGETDDVGTTETDGDSEQKQNKTSVQAMLADGADWFMEVGPGTVLQGLVRRISGGLVNIEGIQ